MPALLTDADFHTFDICFFYFYLGLCVVYNTFRLMHYSAAGQNMYAAVAYRAIDNLLTGLLVPVGFSKLSQLTALIINNVNTMQRSNKEMFWKDWRSKRKYGERQAD